MIFEIPKYTFDVAKTNDLFELDYTFCSELGPELKNSRSERLPRRTQTLDHDTTLKAFGALAHYLDVNNFTNVRIITQNNNNATQNNAVYQNCECLILPIFENNTWSIIVYDIVRGAIFLNHETIDVDDIAQSVQWLRNYKPNEDVEFASLNFKLNDNGYACLTLVVCVLKTWMKCGNIDTADFKTYLTTSGAANDQASYFALPTRFDQVAYFDQLADTLSEFCNALRDAGSKFNQRQRVRDTCFNYNSVFELA